MQAAQGRGKERPVTHTTVLPYFFCVFEQNTQRVQSNFGFKVDEGKYILWILLICCGTLRQSGPEDCTDMIVEKLKGSERRVKHSFSQRTENVKTWDCLDGNKKNRRF